MSKKHLLRHSIYVLLSRSKERSQGARADRKGHLRQFADSIHEAGFGLKHIQGLKEKHIQAVVKKWQNKELKNATIKNRMAAIRYIAEKINKPNFYVYTDLHSQYN